MKTALHFFVLLVVLHFFFLHCAVFLSCAPVCAQVQSGVDWRTVPEISNRRDLAAYMRACCERRMSVIPLVVRNDVVRSSYEVMENQPVTAWYVNTISDDSIRSRIVFTVYYYPGVRVADAYKKRDTSWLSPEERELYAIAVPLAEEARKKESLLQTELFIHDSIINATTYTNVPIRQNNVIPRGKSALGVFLDHKANCQGYADAFYMLGTMAGLAVSFMSGNGKAGFGHTWNTIVIKGKTYFVDVTWNASSFHANDTHETNYIYFNAPREIMAATHTWNAECEPEGIQDYVDGAYFYCAADHLKTGKKYFGASHRTAEEGLKKVADGIVRQKWRFWYLMVPYDSRYSDIRFSSRFFSKCMAKHHVGSTVELKITSMEGCKYMFYKFTLAALRQ